jgi:hypothetical protein
MSVNLRSLIGKLNVSTRYAMEGAAGLCLSRTHYDVVPEHFVIKLLDQTGTDFDLIAKQFSLDRSRLAQDLNGTLDGLKAGNERNPSLGSLIVRMLTESWVVASINYNESSIRTGHAVLALLSDPELSARLGNRITDVSGITPDALAANFPDIVRASSESLPNGDVRPVSTSPAASARIFISYRRGDSAYSAGRIRDHLITAFGRDRVFMDVSDLTPGELYSVVLVDAISQCDVVIAVIGKHWNRTGGRTVLRRLEDKDDWVRQELTAGIEKGKRIIPCLVDDAKMPRPEDLPADVADVARRQATEISPDHFERDVAALIDVLKRIAPKAAKPSA